MFSQGNIVNDEWEWITVHRTPSIVSNQNTNYVDPLFKDFQERGWVVVSVTVLPPPFSTAMCAAVGVLKRPRGSSDS
jgi:hypothetical protein